MLHMCMCTMIGGSGGLVCYPRLAIVTGRDSTATVLQSYAGTGDYFANCITRSVIGAGSTLKHFYMQEQSASAHHIDTITADIGEQSVYKTSLMAAGSLNARANIQVYTMYSIKICTSNV
jgi:SUF system FeS cluster assembly, SufBD